MKIRIVKTASKAQAVQIVRYQNNKRIVLKHIGSASTDSQLQELIHLVNQWIKDCSEQLSFFPDDNPNQIFHLSQSVFLGVKYNFFYSQITSIIDKLICFLSLVVAKHIELKQIYPFENLLISLKK